MYPYREYFKAKVYTIWAHGPLGKVLSLHLDWGDTGFRSTTKPETTTPLTCRAP